jgi:hypothetical protein
VVEFSPNIPVEVALRFATGKTVGGMNGDRVMFSLADNRVMFLDLGVALKVSRLGVKAGEKFFISKTWSGKKGEAHEWTAWLSPETELKRAQAEAQAAGDEETAAKYQGTIDRRLRAGEQANGTFVVDALPDPKPPALATEVAPNPSTAQARPSTRLEDALRTVVAACHAAAEYAQQVGYKAMPQFTSEDIRTMANTLMIQQGGGR